MDELVEQFRERLDSLGVEFSVEEDDNPACVGVSTRRVRLKRGRNQQAYLATFGDEVPLARVVRAESSDRILAIARHIGPKTADACRRAGVQYIDASGNAWLQFGDVLIDVQGRRAATRTRARVAGDLFTASRAQVACVLLAWPNLWHSTQREVALAAGVSLGQANSALRLLAGAGFGPEGRRDDVELLRLWAATFPTGLAQRLTLAAYSGDLKDVRPVGGKAVYRSGEVAADDLLRPASATLYVEDLDPKLAVVNRWRIDAEPNIVVRRAFWTSPVGETESAASKARTAPWPLVYADLLASDDPRVRGVAEEWREARA